MDKLIEDYKQELINDDNGGYGYPVGLKNKITKDVENNNFSIPVKKVQEMIESVRGRIKLEKHTVCANCFSIGIRDMNCICTYQKEYKTITLEFEVCKCCGSLISDGDPADTPFNDEQFKKLEDEL